MGGPSMVAKSEPEISLWSSCMEEQNRVQWVYSARNNQDLAERYDAWASGYDSELAEKFGWAGPQKAADVFSRHVAKDARVLDAGAGTGLVGQHLAGLGYSDLVAIDLSSAMLEEARQKGIYCELRQMVMGDTLDFPTDSFDAVISVGVFTVGHAPSRSLREMVRVTRSGGHIVFTLRPDVYENQGFKGIQTELESADEWTLVEVGQKFQTLPKGEPDVYHQVWVYRVL